MIAPIHPNQSAELTTYRVQLGHTYTLVKGRSKEEAVLEARRQFCHEMPRMWDMIQKLDDSRFVVIPLK